MNCIVSRGGTGINRLGVLKKVDVPVLFIVGSRDDSTWAMNRLAYSNISTENKDKDLRVIDGASHLFEEPGKMQEVIDLSVSWFDTYL